MLKRNKTRALVPVCDSDGGFWYLVTRGNEDKRATLGRLAAAPAPQICFQPREQNLAGESGLQNRLPDYFIYHSHMHIIHACGWA